MPQIGLDVGVFSVKGVLMDDDHTEQVYVPTAGNPAAVSRQCLHQLLDKVNSDRVCIGLSGNNAKLMASSLGIRPILEIEALQAGLAARQTHVESVLSLGHESMYYLELGDGQAVTFFNRNGQCAAGSGSFWHQQSTRMGFNDQELAELALNSESTVKISGRCAVFAKSDMTHAINAGASQNAVAAGLAKALVDLVVTGVAQNRIKGPGRLLVIGGVANNQAIYKYLQFHCQERDIEIEVPPDHEYIIAAGAAQLGTEMATRQLHSEILTTDLFIPDKPLPSLRPELVSYCEPVKTDQYYDLTTIFLGIDCGSVSTKCALLDNKGDFMGGIYLPTAGRPALQLLELVKKVDEEYGDLIRASQAVVACTTGSGRFLAQKILGAAYAVDEITCQAEGVRSQFSDNNLAIIEIGGEDSKFVQIKNGTLFDYNMNPVCAAGTGTFLENLAELLGVNIKEEFSQKAFQAQYAIDLGDTCTLLSQSTLVSAASRGLPLESQLASLAYSSARNYLGKTVENRPMEGQLIFTGATAKNHALAAAFAAECHSQVLVPHHPELTGAMGAALMARSLFLEQGQPVQTGSSLDRLNNYTLAKKSCQAECFHEHNCQLDVIRFADGSKFIYGDRCGRYSELDKRKQKSDLPNYQQIRERLFFEAAGEALGAGPTVGIACSGLYHELYPFWAAFFRSLGARVVLSGQSDEKLLEKGKMDLAAQMCYPIEVLIGHYRALIDKHPDYIFIPEILNMEPLPWAAGWPNSLSCPLIMMVKGVTVNSLDIPEEQVLHAALSFREGRERIKQQMLPAARKLLGEGFNLSSFEQAIEQGYTAQTNFQRALEQEGQRIIENLSNYPEVVFTLILGRSYTLYDPFVAKDVSTFAAQRGLLALPQDVLLEYLRGWYEGRIKSDFLDPRRADFEEYMRQKITDMDNMYAAQHHHMLSAALAAQFFNERACESGLPQLHLVLQDPFRCGPNSMFRHFLENVGGYLRLTLDEHTAPAGMITRLEALRNTCRARQTNIVTPFFTAQTRPMVDPEIKKVYIPQFTQHPLVFKGLFENYGLEAEILPRSRDKDLTLARRYTNGEECLPFIQNIQDYLEYGESHPELRNEGAVLLQGWACGPCRYGLYAPAQAMIINRAGYGEKRVLSLRTDQIIKRFGAQFVVIAFDGMLAIDLLYKMLHQTRPYELHKGESEALFNDFCQKVYKALRDFRSGWSGIATGNHLQPLEKILSAAADQFAAIECEREQLRPRIMLAGEFYVRLDDRCNNDIIKQIEAAGGEVSLAPASEFFIYTTFANARSAELEYSYQRSLPRYFNKVGYASINWLANRDERRLEQAAARILHGYEEPSVREILENSIKYVPEHTAGEPPMTLGRTGALADQERMGGAIFMGPFTCMPAAVVEAHQSLLSQEKGLPIISVYYDGRDNTNRDEFIESLVFQAKQKVSAQGLCS